MARCLSTNLKLIAALGVAAHTFMMMPRMCRPAYAILDGQTVASNDPIATSTIAFVADEHDPAEPNACTASIIGDDLVVTAAHCLKSNVVGMKLVFSTDVRKTDAALRLIDGFAVLPAYHSGYSGGSPPPTNNSDLAVLHFPGGLPAGFKVAEILPQSSALRSGEPVVTAGFGFFTQHEIKTGRNDGILKKGQFSLGDARFAPTEIEVRQNGLVRNSNGDSGGPAYVQRDGKNYLLGVDNYDFDDKRGHFEVFADIRSHLPWIQAAGEKIRKSIQGTGPAFGDDFWTSSSNPALCPAEAGSNLLRIIGEHGFLMDSIISAADAATAQEQLNQTSSAKTGPEWFSLLQMAIGNGATPAQVEEVLKKGVKADPTLTAKQYHDWRAQVLNVAKTAKRDLTRSEPEKNKQLESLIEKYVPANQ